MSNPGKIGPASAYAMNTIAMIGSGQPMLRRVASSSATTRIEPITTSSVLGLPTRKVRSSNTQGM